MNKHKFSCAVPLPMGGMEQARRQGGALGAYAPANK